MSEPVHKFAHDAMATTFEIFLATEDKDYAASTAQQAWALLDTLEDKLSRFRPHSDISILNLLEPGESVRLSIEAFDCLKLAFELSTETGGAFDVSLATIMDEIRNERTLLIKCSHPFLSNLHICFQFHHQPGNYLS